MKEVDGYYLSSLLFKEYAEHEKALYFLNRAYRTQDFSRDVVSQRELGLQKKRKFDLFGAKEAFAFAAKAGDPISQYELAKLCCEDREIYRELLEAASHKLVQAKVSFYRFQLEAHQYEKAYGLLVEILLTVKGIRLEGIPHISTEFDSSCDDVALSELLYEISIRDT